MGYNGIKNLDELIEFIKQSEYEESSEDILTTQFLDNAKVESVNPQPYIDNDGIGYYDYGGATGYDAGKDYLVLDGNAIITTMVEIEPLLSATENLHLAKQPEDLKRAIDEFFLTDENRPDTEFILGEIIGNDGKPDLDETYSEMYDNQKMKLVLNDISITQSNNDEVYLTINVSWQ
jgi:hypothetical protein